MYHADEAAARELVKVASQDAPNPDDANILVDTGWFQEEATSLPTKDQLQLLQSKVGGASALDAPEYWTQVNDPTVAERTTLKIDSSEAAAVVDSFMRTLVPPRFNKVKVSNHGLHQTSPRTIVFAHPLLLGFPSTLGH